MEFNRTYGIQLNSRNAIEFVEFNKIREIEQNSWNSRNSIKSMKLNNIQEIQQNSGNSK